jgi:hypothetical protein
MEHGNETSRFMNAILYMSMYVMEEILVIIRKITSRKCNYHHDPFDDNINSYYFHIQTIECLKLPDNLKSLVIQQGLAGIQRDKIAVDNGLSAGANKYPNEWRSALGFYAADALRDLVVTLKRIGITPAQCAIGFRVAMMLNRLGKGENFESFMSDVYNRCCNIPGLAPERIASYITSLLGFSQTVPFSQI